MAALLWGEGDRENLPLLERISGPQRLRQVVADPLPPAICEARGGYSGFPQGQAVTRFRFRGGFRGEVECIDLPAGWRPLATASSTVPYAPYSRQINATPLFEQDQPQPGILFVPWPHPPLRVAICCHPPAGRRARHTSGAPEGPGG